MKLDRQLIAIGLEAAEPSIMDEMIELGDLPNFASLKKRGTSGRLRSCAEVSSGATWVSVNTGTNPAKHGMAYMHRQIETGTYKIVKKYANETGVEFFWKQLSKKGVQTAVLDLPGTYPEKAFDGTILVGWGAEGLNWKQCSRPRSLIREIKRRFGRHPLESWYQERPADLAGWEKLVLDLVSASKQRSEAYRWLLREHHYDLVLAGYAEPHWIGHFFWFLRDETHPEYDPELAAHCGNAIQAVYQEIDRGIGNVIKDHPNADFMVFSQTGMGPNYSGLHLLQAVLDRTGFGSSPLREQKRQITRSITPYRLLGPYAIKRIENLVGPKVLRNTKRLFPERLWDRMTRRFLNWGHGWERSKAFVLPNDYTGAIRINLRGREPNGLVEPGDEYWRVCKQIREILLEAVNPDTGEPAVSEVKFTRNHYQGAYQDNLPDIIVRWRRDRYIGALQSPKFGRVDGRLPDKRTGAHGDHGLFLAAGPNLRAANLNGDRDIMDIAPTIYRYFDEPIPGYMDGRIIAELFQGG